MLISMKFHKKVLRNGMRVITVPMKDTKTVTVMVMVEAGAEYETKKINGLSHFLEHMCFKGTTKRPGPKIISTEFDEMGAESNAFTGNEYTSYYAKAHAKHLPKMLDLISDLYLDPLLPTDELQKEKGVVIEEINMYEDIPQHKVEDILDKLLYGDQPAGFTILGPKENIQRLKREDLMAYRRKHYVAKGTVLVVAGKINEKKLYPAIEKAFSNIPKDRKHPKSKTRVSQSKPKVMIHYKETDQAHLRLAFRTYDLYDERNWPLSVLATVLGAGMSSRLFQKMRDELGLCYYINAQNRSATDHGQFVVSIGSNKDKVEEAIVAIVEELRNIIRDPVSEEELKKAKEFSIGHLFLGLESSDDFTTFYGFQELFHKKMITPEEWTRKIKKVTARDVQKMAREIFKTAKMNLAAVGPFKSGKKFLPLLKI